ncbi:MAG: PPOX class F420-dependent oxidoreductase [Anaerolineae bacterium]|nr:PPOX class F420-dependent oxidoreductase [Anaerolineae bacterium]
MASIPPEFLDLFEKKAFAHLATLMPDGTPQVTPVWVDFDGTHILVNTARGRVKDRNMQARPQVAVAIIDSDNPYRYLAVRGRVVAMEEDGAAEHINRVLSPKYTGRIGDFGRGGEVRRLYRILPEHVDAHG